MVKFPQLKGMTWRPVDKKNYDFHKQKEISDFINSVIKTKLITALFGEKELQDQETFIGKL